MWVTKLLISPVKKRIFCPKTTKFGPKLAFLVNLGQAMQAYSGPCRLVGWWLWRAGCILQDTYLLYRIQPRRHVCLCTSPNWPGFSKVLNFHVWNGSPQGASARSPCSCQIDDVSSLQNCVFTNNREMQHIQWDAAHAETTRWLESVCQCWHHRGHSQTPLPTSLLCGVETCDCEVPKCLLYNLLCPQCPFFK